jgi:hypothetical protein
MYIISSGTTIEGLYHDTTDAEENKQSSLKKSNIDYPCPLRLKRESTTKNMIDD